MGPPLQNSYLDKSIDHDYIITGKTLLDGILMPFWDEVIEWCPWHWSPSSMSVVGLILNLTYMWILFLISPDAKAEIPPWISLASGVLIFVYLTIDALDGKQARRTKTETCVSGYMDHACDAVSQICVVLSTCISVRLGKEPVLLMIFLLGTMFIFYVHQWYALLTGVEEYGKFDVLEASVFCIVLHFVNGIFGPSFFDTMIPFTEVKLFTVFAYAPACILLLQAVRKFTSVMMVGLVDGPRSPVPIQKKWLPLTNVICFFSIALYLAYKTDSGLFCDNLVLFLLTFGAAFAKPSQKVVLSYELYIDMQPLDHGILGLVGLLANQMCGSLVDDTTALYLCLVFQTADLLYYNYRVVSDMCSYYRIYCFDITKRPPGTHGLADDKYIMLKCFDPKIHTKGHRAEEWREVNVTNKIKSDIDMNAKRNDS